MPKRSIGCRMFRAVPRRVENPSGGSSREAWEGHDRRSLMESLFLNRDGGKRGREPSRGRAP